MSPARTWMFPRLLLAPVATFTGPMANRTAALKGTLDLLSRANCDGYMPCPGARPSVTHKKPHQWTPMRSSPSLTDPRCRCSLSGVRHMGVNS